MSQEIVDLIMDVLHSLTHRSFSPLPVTYGGVTRLSPASFKNKLTLRDEVLRVLSGGAGSAFTIEVLRGSSFIAAEFLGLCQFLSYYLRSFLAIYFETIKASSSGGQTSNSRNASTSYDSHAATYTQPSAASNRGYYINHINYQYYSYVRPQDLQHSSNNKPIITTSTSLGLPRSFFISTISF